MRVLKFLATSLFLLIALTIATRLTFAIIEARKIPPDQLSRAVFQTETGSIARSIAEGKGFSSPYERESGLTAILPPVYPLVVAGIFHIFGIQSAASFYFLVALNIIFAALTCIPIYKIGLRLGGIFVATVATWFWALFPNGIFIPFEWIWETTLSALLAATLLWATFKLRDASSLRNWFIYGLLWGVSLMTNPALGAAMPFLILWGAWQKKSPFSKNLTRAGIALLTAILCCLPWTIRNYNVFHRFIPLRSGFAFELYIGNNENYSSPFVYPPRISYERELIRYLHMGEIPFMEEEKHKALAFIKANPGTFAELCGQRFIEFWTGLPHPVEAWKSHPSLPDRFLLLCNLFAPCAAFGGAIILLFRRCAFALPVLAFPVFFPVVYYITHSSLRYRHPIDPILFLLVAISIGVVVPRPARIPANPISSP